MTLDWAHAQVRSFIDLLPGIYIAEGTLSHLDELLKDVSQSRTDCLGRTALRCLLSVGPSS